MEKIKIRIVIKVHIVFLRSLETSSKMVNVMSDADFFQTAGRTIIGQLYCNLFEQRDVKINEGGSGLQKKNMTFEQDNVPANKGTSCSLFNLHSFPQLKKFLHEQRFP